MKFGTIFLGALLLLISVQNAHSFGDVAAGCSADCKQCHTMTVAEAEGIVKNLNIQAARVVYVKQSQVKSLWEVGIELNGKKGVLFVDFSKQYIVSGPIVKISASPKNSSVQPGKNQKRVDLSKIPLNNDLVIGDPKAKIRVIVFTDPDCPFCGQLHNEIKKAASKRKDIAFFIKLYPLPFHKDAYWKSKSIICSKSLEMLEDNFLGKSIPKIECTTNEVDDNIKIANSSGISGTPALIFPDGSLHMGAIPVEAIISIIDGQ